MRTHGFTSAKPTFVGREPIKRKVTIVTVSPKTHRVMLSANGALMTWNGTTRELLDLWNVDDLSEIMGRDADCRTEKCDGWESLRMVGPWRGDA